MLVDVEFWEWYDDFKNDYKDFAPSDLGEQKLKQAWMAYRHHHGATLEQMPTIMYHFISQFGTIPDD